jgi:Transposase DDE domain
LRNEKVSVAAMAASAGARTGERAKGRDVAVIQDTSEIAVGGVELGRAGFGPIGKGGATRGVLVHAAIAVDSQGALLGLVDEAVWTREGGKRDKSDRSRLFAEKESHRWLKTCERAAERLAEARSITMVSDAESDIYELFAGKPEGLHLLVRAARDRRLESGGLLSETVDALAPCGTIERLIPAAPGRKERIARLDLTYAGVLLKAPEAVAENAPAHLAMTVVEVCERGAPEGVAPVRWLLLTTHAVTTAARAAEIVDLYRGRFFIEQLFRTLKSAGFNIEEAEIEDPRAFINFTGLALIAAVSVMQLVKARDGGTGQTLEDCFAAEDRPLVAALSRKLAGKTLKQQNPHPPDDLAFASWVIARLGGWTGYYGKPGPAVMRHGLERFHAIKLGAEIAKDV